MELQGQKSILVANKEGEIVKCCIERIVCIVSSQGRSTVYEYDNLTNIIIATESHHRLPWYEEKITDTRFFKIREGTLVNACFVARITDERILKMRVGGIPQLVVAEDQKAAFVIHLSYW